MAITQNLSDINTIIYKGNDCKIVHFGDACTWAKKYTLTVPSAAIQNTATYGKTITVSRTSKQATLSSTGTIGTISATGNTIFASTWNPTTFTVYHGDIIEVTTNSGSYEAEYSSYSITGDTAVNIVKVGSTPTPTTVSFTVNKTSYTVTNITLENILQKYNNDISKMPQDPKDEILRQQFINIEIKYDVDADIMKL